VQDNADMPSSRAEDFYLLLSEYHVEYQCYGEGSFGLRCESDKMECLVCLLITHSGTSAIAVLAKLGLTEYVCQAYHLSTKCEHVLVALMTLDDLLKLTDMTDSIYAVRVERIIVGCS
jgi:hypothetical protein